MYKIAKRFEFEASHQLFGLPEGHQCGRLHGHSYTVEIELQGTELNAIGFIVDYGELKPFKALVDGKLDHRHLNDVLPFMNPTAENLARWLYEQAKAMWPEITCARVSETGKTWAEYRPASAQQ